MKIIIAGSRDFVDYEDLCKTMIHSNAAKKITELVSGGARGADRLGERWAKENNIPIKQFIPEWDKLGKRAGMVRNEQMGNYADGLLAFWDGESRGTKYMIEYMKSLDKHVYVRRYDMDEKYTTCVIGTSTKKA